MKKTVTFTAGEEKFILEASFTFKGYFSLTADIYRKARNGRKVWTAGGCLHEEIEKHIPEWKPFINLHLCDKNGLPTYTVKNGFYIMQSQGIEMTAKYLGVSRPEAEILTSAEDEKRFSYLLEKSTILATRKAQAEKAFQYLCINPESLPDEELNFTPLSEEERTQLEQAATDGYYTAAAINARQTAREQAQTAKARQEICERYDKQIETAIQEKNIHLAVFDYGIHTDNYIYYSHSKTLCFNWQDYKPGITEQEYNTFCEWAHKQPVFFGINFERRNK